MRAYPFQNRLVAIEGFLSTAIWKKTEKFRSGPCPLSPRAVDRPRRRAVAAGCLGDVIARVKHTGETVLLTKSSEPVARLVSARPSTQATGGEIMRALASLPHDAEFADDLEVVNQADRMLTTPQD